MFQHIPTCSYDIIFQQIAIGQITMTNGLFTIESNKILSYHKIFQSLNLHTYYIFYIIYIHL